MSAYRFGKFSDAETPHIVGLPVEEVFADNVEENAAHFLPLLAVDLADVHTGWEGQVHVVYGGLSVGGVSFHVKTEDGASQLVYKGAYNFEEHDMAERAAKQGYMAFAAVDGVEDFSPENWQEEQERWTKAVAEHDAALQFTCHVGGSPLWTQSDDTPACPRCDKDMQFVVQVRATVFSDEVGDEDLFEFYCPECKIQTQVDQAT